MPRVTYALLFALLLAAIGGPVPAQETVDSFIRTPYSVPDSQEVLHLRLEARRAIAARNFDSAALKLQTILDYYTSEVILVGDEIDQRFIGARIWVNAYIRSLPEAARAAYRLAAEPPARELLDRATRDRDRKLLLTIIRRFYESGAGPDTLRALASTALVSGRFADAAFRLRQLIRDFPEARTDVDVASLLFALARGGDHAGFRALLAEHPTLLDAHGGVEVGGDNVGLGDFAKRARGELERLAETPPVSATAWPVYGGSAAREAPARPVGKIGGVVWKRNTNWRVRDDDRVSTGGRGYSGPLNGTILPSYFPIFPAVHGGTTFYQNGGTIFATNLLTGQEEWYWNGPLVSNIEGRTNPGTVLSVAVNDSMVVANLEIPVPGTLSREVRKWHGRSVIFPIPQRRLFALDRTTGELIWSHGNDAIRGRPDEALLENINMSSPPLILGDTIYATASTFDSRYFCYLFAVDAATGKVRWRTVICTGQQELNLFGRVIKELAPGAVSERDGVLYVVSNLGVAAAVDRRTGELQWIKGYPQIPIPLAMTWHTAVERETTWTNAPPIVTDDTLYFTPTDSWDLVALNRKDGSLRFLYPDGEDGWTQPEPRYLLGVNESYVYLAGRQVTAVNRHTGKLVWRTTQGAFLKDKEKREEAHGRGLVTDDAILTMTAAGLYRFHPETGKRLEFTPMDALSRALRSGRAVAGGNLTYAGGVLLIAGREQIGAWYSTEEIHAELKARADADPTNPRLAIELGDIYATWEKFGDAVREYERGLSLLGRLPAEERERLEFAANKGLFTIHLGEGRKAWQEAADIEDGRKKKAKRNAAAKRFRAALDSAVDEDGRLQAMLSLAGYHLATGRQGDLRDLYEAMERGLGPVRYEFASYGLVPAGLYALVNLADLAREMERPQRAIEHLTKILSHYREEELFRNTDSGAYARREIDRIISDHGRETYAPFEDRARKEMDRAANTGDTDGLLGLLDLYPNSRASEQAAVGAARLLIAAGRHRDAAIALRRFLADFPEATTAPTALTLLAKTLEERGYLESARSALSRLKRRYGEKEIEVDGKRVKAGEYAAGRLEEERYKSLGVGEKKISLPLDLLWIENEGATSYVRLLEPAGVAPPGTEGNLIIGTNGLVRCVDAVHHRPLWKKRMSGIVTRPIYVEGSLVLVNSNAITAIDPDSGAKRWEVPNDASVRAVGTGSGLIFVLTADFHRPRDLLLRCFSPRGGQVIWRREIRDHSVYDILYISEEAIGIASLDPAGVTVYDLTQGRLRYRIQMKPRTLGRMPSILDGDKLLIVRGTNRVDLHDLTTGRGLWQHRLAKGDRFKGGVTAAGSMIYSDSRDNLICLDAASGQVRWKVTAEPNMAIEANGDAADAEHVFTVRRRDTDNAYFVVARSVRTGGKVWQREIVKSRNADFATIVTDQYLIVHLNSFDRSQSAWTSKTMFIDKTSGTATQELTVDALQGFYTTATVSHGLLALSARGRVAVFGSK